MFRVHRIILTKKLLSGVFMERSAKNKEKEEEGERGRRRAVCARIQEVRAAAAVQH